MDIDQTKWFLRVFAGGNKLNTVTVSDLYLSGYIGIELLSPGKEPSDGHNRKREASLGNLKALGALELARHSFRYEKSDCRYP